ncbi:MAG: D-glycerate dehydrogenase [Actinobacteria bacterium]|nr:D-glycerate dehydrogenase [Actinomycetota bacterium]
MPRIAITRALPSEAVARLEQAGAVASSPHPERRLARDELLRHVAGADALVTMLYDTVDGELMDAAGDGLRVIANVAVGYDNIDVEAARSRGIAVANTPGVLTDATADLAFGLLLSVTRRLGEGERLIRRGDAWRWELDFMLGSGLQGQTIGIVGFGEIGRAVARRARAFGMEVAYSSRRPASEAVEQELGARLLELDHLLADAKVVSLHCPLTPATRHLIDAPALARMRPDAYLVNTARGPVVDEQALVRALEAGEIAGAALDVFEREPEVEAGLSALENVVLAPHLGSATHETRAAMAALAAENVAAVLSGTPPPSLVEPAPVARGDRAGD